MARVLTRTRDGKDVAKLRFQAVLDLGHRGLGILNSSSLRCDGEQVPELDD